MQKALFLKAIYLASATYAFGSDRYKDENWEKTWFSIKIVMCMQKKERERERKKKR